MDDAARAAFDWSKTVFAHFVTGIQNVKWEDLLQSAKDHIWKNPKMSAFQIVMTVVTVVPGLVVMPAFAAMGFSSIGPVAGSAAAGFQSANGATAAFSFLQSVPMAGYGAPVVNGVVTGASAAAAAITQYFKRR